MQCVRARVGLLWVLEEMGSMQNARARLLSTDEKFGALLEMAGDEADGSHRCSAVNYGARGEAMKENWEPKGVRARGGGSGSDLH